MARTAIEAGYSDRTSSYSVNARVQQLWRIPAQFLVLCIATLFAHTAYHEVDLNICWWYLVVLIPSGLWIATWHPDLRLDDNGVSAWRFGVCLQRVDWSMVTEIKKNYRGKRPAALKLRRKTGMQLVADDQTWWIEIKSRLWRLFRTSFSSRIMGAETLVLIINAKIREWKIPVTESAAKY